MLKHVHTMSLSSKVEVNLPGNRNENSYKPKLLIESQFLLNSNTPFKLQEIYFFLVVIEITLKNVFIVE